MSLTNDELNNFHQFALTAIQNGGKDATIEQLVSLWRAARDRRETNDAIRQSLAELDAGQGRPIEEFLDEMKSKHNIPTDA